SAATRPAEDPAPFDLALLAPTEGRDLAGVFAVRPAAILKRPEAKALVLILDAQIDTLTAGFKAGDVGLHVGDVEQVMGRLYLRGENRPGKRFLVLGVNVLRTTRDVDWEKLRDRCGPAVKRCAYRGEAYVSAVLPPELVD